MSYLLCLATVPCTLIAVKAIVSKIKLHDHDQVTTVHSSVLGVCFQITDRQTILVID